MGTRYYTEEAYAQIKQTIEQIQNADVHPVKDFFGDFFLRLAQFLKFYSVDQYKNDMQNWYNRVLDSHDTTLRKVDNIFKEVEDVDSEYQEILEGAAESIVSFRNTLNCLRDVISGKVSLADGKQAADGYLASGMKSLNGAYDRILTRMEKRNLSEAGLELVGDTLKLVGSFLGLCVPASPTEYGVKCKKFLDTFTATLGDLGALTTGVLVFGTFGVGSWFGMDRKDYLDFRYNQLAQARNDKDTNSITDLLGGAAEDMDETLESCPESSPYYPIVKAAANGSQFAAGASDTVDLAVDAYDIFSDLKDSYENIGEWIFGKSYTEQEFLEAFDKKDYWDIVSYKKTDNGWIIKAKGSPTEIITQIVSDRIGVPLSGWTDPDKYGKNIVSTAGTIWSYGEKLLPDPTTGESNASELLDVFMGNFKDIGLLKDVMDFAQKAGKLIQTDPTVSPSSGIAAAGGNKFESPFGRVGGPLDTGKAPVTGGLK